MFFLKNSFSMICNSLVKARGSGFCFGILYVMQLAFSGRCGTSPDGWEIEDISWKEFANDTTTPSASISCKNVWEGINRIECTPNGVTAILKVNRKVDGHEQPDNVALSTAENIMQSLLFFCNGRDKCTGDATAEVEEHCLYDEDSAFGNPEFHVEYLCIAASEINDICADHQKLNHNSNMLYVVSPQVGNLNSNCNFSLTSDKRRQWSVFVFHLGEETLLDVYNEDKLVFSTDSSAYDEVIHPGLLTYLPLLGQSISFAFSGRLDFLMAIKDAEGINVQGRTTTVEYSTWTSPSINPTNTIPVSTSPSDHPDVPTTTSTAGGTVGTPPDGPDGGQGEKAMYIGVGAGIGGVLILLIVLPVIFVLLRKRRRRERSPQMTEAHYNQPDTIRKRKIQDPKSHGKDGNLRNKGRVNRSNPSSISINSDVPPPVLLFLGMEKSNGEDENLYVNMTPTAPMNNSKVETNKLKPRTSRRMRETK